MLTATHWLNRKLKFSNIHCGHLTVTLASGRTFEFIGDDAGFKVDIQVHRFWRFFWLVNIHGRLGFAQAYIEKAIDTSDLHALMRFALDNAETLSHLTRNNSTGGFWHKLKHKRRHNSIHNSRRNIQEHYDLGNDFYSLWLDDTMSYSSGIYDTPGMELVDAQKRKYNRIIEQLDGKPGQHILEIGSGWGGFAEVAARRGYELTGLTLSREQHDFFEGRMAIQGYQDKIKCELMDYRNVTQTYDHIVSIEMFEAVGKEYWDTYFRMLKRSLKASGKAVLQIITIDDRFADSYQNSVDFIQAYIFPGGLLPSIEQLHTLAAKHGFEIKNEFEFGQDYAKTLQKWSQLFNHYSETLDQLGYDETFQRTWNYYLDYCRAGFEAKHISVYQITLEHYDEKADV